MKLIFSILLVVSLWTDSVLLDAYRHEDMSVWKACVESADSVRSQYSELLYEYGLCGYMVDREKESAGPYVERFKQHVEAQKQTLPAGHYEMYMSAVYVYELRLHRSIHPLKAMNLAKEAARLAPEDPLTLSYYGTCLYYAPKPFGSKQESLKWFEKAKTYFADKQWRWCWVREANQMYIHTIMQQK